jgi:mannitol/fructose-specific phosphotransferase system IIA component (Ntr-type)
MNLSRYLTEELVKLEMNTVLDPPPENGSFEKYQIRSKELILSELVELLDSGARIGNRTKLLLDFVNREKKATTGIGFGVAIPHIRSMQAKEFMLAFARSHEGYEFDSLDKEKVHMFFVMASPPYDDNMYLKAFKQLATMLQYDSFREELMSVSSPGEVIRALRQMENVGL